jgi:hypothetical protein
MTTEAQRLAELIRAEAATSSRAGQLQSLEAIADRVQGLGGVSACPTREALADVVQRALWENHRGQLTDAEWEIVKGNSGPTLGQSAAEARGVVAALLAADHLWAEQPTEPDNRVWLCAKCGQDAHAHSLATSTCVWEPYLADPARPSVPVVDREALEEWSFSHRPITSMKDGSIAGCTCLDRVFVNGAEDWDSHIAAELIASGLFVDRATVEREAIEKDGYRADVALGFALRTLSDEDGARFLAVWQEHRGSDDPLADVRAEQREIDAQIVERRFASVLPVASVSLAAAIRGGGAS